MFRYLAIEKYDNAGGYMNFQQLQYVVEVSRCGSINKAAQKLFLAQSSVSAAIKELEAELGIILMRRGNRGVEFTRAGKEFLGYATSLLEQKEYVENIYKGSSTEAPAHFCVATQRYPFTEDAFIRLLQNAQNKRFLYSIRGAGMDSVIEDVYDHRADIGVIFLSNTTEKYILRLLAGKGIEFHELIALQPAVFVRQGHPLAAKKSLRAEDLEGYMYLSFEHDQGVAMDFSEEFHLLAYKRPTRLISVSDRAMAVNVIASTDAITTGSGLIVEGLMDMRMISIPLEGEDNMRLGWIKAKGYRLSRQALEFITLLQQSIEDALAYTEQMRERFTGTGKI